MKPPDPLNAEELLAESAQLETQAMGMMSYWRDAAHYCLPLRAAGFTGSSGASYSPPTTLQTDVAVDALNVLASGMLSWITPSQRNWFAWEPAEESQGSAVADWLADCTLRAHKILANSNFYHALHIAYLDLGAFGTSAIYAEASSKQTLNFRVWHTGTFWCAEDKEGQVDRVFRKVHLTANQAVQTFGDNAPEVARQAIAANKLHDKVELIHAVIPDDQGRYQTAYLDAKERRVFGQGALDSKPVFVTRWNKYVDDSPWGVSPAMQSLADMRGSNYMEGLLASIGNIHVNPRVIKNVDQVGQVVLKAGGVTQVKNMIEAPRVWGEPGNYTIGLDLLNRVDDRIRRAFHVPLFEQFATIDDRVTATLVRAKQAEQLSRISPAVTLQNTDLINPLLERVFMLLWKGGHFAQAPAAAFVKDVAGQHFLAYPRTTQINRMSAAVAESQEYGFNTLLDSFMPLVSINPELLDNLDADAAFRATARGKGLPKEYLRTEDERDGLRAARAEARQAEQLAAVAAQNPEQAAQLAQSLAAA